MLDLLKYQTIVKNSQSRFFPSAQKGKMENSYQYFLQSVPWYMNYLKLITKMVKCVNLLLPSAKFQPLRGGKKKQKIISTILQNEWYEYLLPFLSTVFCSPPTRDVLVGLWLVSQWMDNGRSGALGASAQWPVPMALSKGPGSAQQPPMGDLNVAVTGQKAESAIILTAQVKSWAS